MWPYYGYPRLLALGDGTLTYAIANLMIRFLVWVAPVWIYLRRLDHVDPIEYLKLRGHLGRGLLVALVLTVVNFLGTVARLGPPHPSLQSVTWNSMLGTSVLIGFIEEVPYRGFMLQKLTEDFGFWPAALGTSLLFVAVHIPGWIALHMLTVDRAVSIFVFGAVMALAFRYARSLWAPILAHSTNDFMSFVLFHV